MKAGQKTIEELFPGCRFSADEITWVTGDWVQGYKGQDVSLDGEFSSAQLRALADWMDSQIEGERS